MHGETVKFTEVIIAPDRAHASTQYALQTYYTYAAT